MGGPEIAHVVAGVLAPTEERLRPTKAKDVQDLRLPVIKRHRDAHAPVGHEVHDGAQHERDLVGGVAREIYRVRKLRRRGGR